MLDVLKRVLAASRGGTNATRRMAAGWLFTLLAIASVPIALQPVYAESYPERTIKIVVPFSARRSDRCCGSVDRAVALFQTGTERRR